MVRISTAPLRALPRARPTARTPTAPTLIRSLFVSAPRLNAGATPTSQVPRAGAGLQGNTDLMTGEVIRSADIDPSRLEVELTKSPKTIPPSSELTFGRTFTDHMLCIPWNSTTGWGAPKIQPYGPLSLDPSSTVLHYAPTLFEGMKAYKSKDGVARLFRPNKNMERMVNSARRLAFPDFSGEALEELIKKLVEIDSKWIPTDPGTSLYIRPTMIGTQAGLGVGASTDVLLFVIASPVGPYYSTGFKPVKLLATTQYVRAAPGGTGSYKLGANYAGGVVPQMEAAAKGYQQILWLLGPEHMLTEVGTMNLFLVFKKEDGTTELVTPPLGTDSVILPGVTRDSILSLARDHASGKIKLDGLPKNMTVSERNLTMKDVVQGRKDGSLLEVFGSGTAAIVSCVDGIGYQDQLIDIPVGQDGLGDFARVMLREIVGRQTGEIPSDWSVVVNPSETDSKTTKK
ncbi:hypothetical protein JCM10212_006711 [Sporobolomyces blumeae]